MSTVTVTPATIVIVRGQVVWRAVTSIIDSDTMLLASLSKLPLHLACRGIAKAWTTNVGTKNAAKLLRTSPRMTT